MFLCLVIIGSSHGGIATLYKIGKVRFEDTVRFLVGVLYAVFHRASPVLHTASAMAKESQRTSKTFHGQSERTGI